MKKVLDTIVCGGISLCGTAMSANHEKATAAVSERRAEISNSMIRIAVNAAKGTYDVFNVRRNEALIKDARIEFATAPYVGLEEIESSEHEIRAISSRFGSGDADNEVVAADLSGTAFADGESLTLVSRKRGTGEGRVSFTLYHDRPFIEIGFSYRNLGKEPVRLRNVTVLESAYMPAADRTYLKLLNGDSGWEKTFVRGKRDMTAENNALCYFADPDRPRSLVAGGLTYADYRKYMKVNEHRLRVSARDPVGKRVDPDRVYHPADQFYLDGITDNPFAALEAYAQATEKARDIALNYYTFPSVCMWFLSVNHFGGDTGTENSSVGSVEEMRRIADTGFLKYYPVAVRLVPDNYEQNNEQGWWDNKHWQMHGRKRRCVVDHHYKKPCETTAKWAGAVRELGGIPLTYFQPGIRSEDYAEAHPDHMLYNQAHKYVLRDGKRVPDPHGLIGKKYGKLWQETYDYTDPDFLRHWREVNHNLKGGGVQGVFYDYPSRAFAERGGFENRYTTATHAYRNVFRVARDELGPDAYLQERGGPGSDATLEFVSSVRTAGDTNVLTPDELGKVALRWYKNRRLTNYDMDGKALMWKGHGNNRRRISERERRAILTMSYTASGRLLLTESFRHFSDSVVHDLSRVIPFHAAPLSARPLDAFGSPPREAESDPITVRTSYTPPASIPRCPRVYDFAINDTWHQLVLYNYEQSRRNFNVSVNDETAFGGMGLDANREYYLYDFWNDRFAGKVSGGVQQTLSAGEARVLSVHAVEDHPQWISTDRHLMQGYGDLVEKPIWDEESRTLSAVSSVIGGEPYCVTIALNGYGAESCRVKGAKGVLRKRDEPGLADLVIEADRNTDAQWSVVFARGSESAGGE